MILFDSVLYDTFIALVITSGLLYYYYYYYYLSKGHRKRTEFAKQFPGPVALPIVGNMLSFLNTDDIVLKLVKYSEQYNYRPYRVWRENHLFIVMSDPEDFEDVFHSSQMLDKGDAFCDGFKLFCGDGLICGPVEKWRKSRKSIQPSLVANCLNNYVPKANEKIRQLLEILEDRIDGKEFDAWDYIPHLFFDILNESYNDVGCQMLQEKDGRFHAATKGLLDYVSARIYLPRWYVDINQYLYHRTIKDLMKDVKVAISPVIKKYNLEAYFSEDYGFVGNAKMSELISDAQIDNPKFRRFTDCIKDKHYNVQDRIDELITMTTGGTETGSLTTSFVLMILGIYQDIQDKVYEELLETFGDNDRDAEIQDLTKLVYLEQVINEVLRHFPVVPYMYRETKNDIKIGRYVVPEGVTIVISVIGSHTNSKYYPDPKKFNPDNFSKENTANRYKYAFLPFSFGPRNCIGKAFVIMEIKLVISAFLRRYRVQSNVKFEDIRISSGFCLGSANGYKISIVRRK